MAILVIAEHDNTILAAATLNTVAAAQRIGGDIHVLVAGKGCRSVAEAAARIVGVTRVLLADVPAYTHQLAENLAPLIVELARGYSHLLAPATANGKNLLPRVAALLDVDQISEITRVIDSDTFERQIYAGRAIATVQSSASVKVITIHTAMFKAVAAQKGSAIVKTVGASCNAGISSVIAHKLIAPERPALTAAENGITITHDRRHADNRQPLRDFADKFEAALGAAGARHPATHQVPEHSPLPHLPLSTFSSLRTTRRVECA